MIAILDDLIRALRHHEQKPPDQYRLIRPGGRYYDAYHWTWNQGLDWDSADARRRALEAWLRLRQKHHVAWLERGGSDRG